LIVSEENAMTVTKIGYVGTDGRSFLAALDTSRATSELYAGEYQGVVVRGTPAMAPWAERMQWPVGFIPTRTNHVEDYAQVLIQAFDRGELDLALIMPESLIFQGLVDRVAEAGHGEKIIGPDSRGAFIEADKIAGKRLCREAGIPVAPAWKEVDAKDYPAVLQTALDYLHDFGGAVLKYPYSAGGKGARLILNPWEIREVYDLLLADYKIDYAALRAKKDPGRCSSKPAWPARKSASPFWWINRGIFTSCRRPWTTRSASRGRPGSTTPLPAAWAPSPPTPWKARP
jgi:phosphoribosylamine---glycine ligase